MEMTTEPENIAREDIESDSAISTERDSPGGSQSSRGSGSKSENASECLVGSLLDTPNNDSSKVPDVEFKKGPIEKVVDHPAALDGDDVGLSGKGEKENEAIVLDIPDQTNFEADTETSEGAVVGRSNDAMDADDICDTSF